MDKQMVRLELPREWLEFLRLREGDTIYIVFKGNCICICKGKKTA